MATELLENTIATLKVLRTSDQGAFLDGQTGNTNDDILLHKDQQTSPVAIGDEVEVGCGSVLNPGTVIGKNTNIYPLSSVRGVVQSNSIYKNQNEIVKKI